MSLAAFGTGRNGRCCYYGRYKDGEVVYFYDEADGGRVYHGEFWFTRTVLIQPFGLCVDTARGRYAGGRKEGRWLFKHDGNGVRRRLEVHYTGGRRDGLYSYKSSCGHRAVDFFAGETRLYVNMAGGRPVGKIAGRFGAERYSGCYDSDGKPDGLWTLDASRTARCRVDYELWEHGLMKDSYSVDVSTGRKSAATDKIADFVTGFIGRECKPLESMAGR